ncbi:MAG: hypothetical protein ACO1OQ_04770 [Rufibacter sp.]
MRTAIIFILILLTLTGCFLLNTKEGPFLSPTKEYNLEASVDSKYNKVYLIVNDRNGEEIGKINSEASNFHKWAAGWMSHGDTVVLYSSDIGTRSYSVLAGKVNEIELYIDTVQSGKILRRAENLYIEKYK